MFFSGFGGFGWLELGAVNTIVVGVSAFSGDNLPIPKLTLTPIPSSKNFGIVSTFLYAESYKNRYRCRS